MAQSVRSRRSVIPGSSEPFYAPKTNGSTSSEIIEEARASLKNPTRPFTPLDRSLFHISGGGNNSSQSNSNGRPRSGGERPSSAYSIGRKHFYDSLTSSSGDLSRPPSGKLAPIVSPSPPPQLVADEDHDSTESSSRLPSSSAVRTKFLMRRRSLVSTSEDAEVAAVMMSKSQSSSLTSLDENKLDAQEKSWTDLQEMLSDLSVAGQEIIAAYDNKANDDDSGFSSSSVGQYVGISRLYDLCDSIYKSINSFNVGGTRRRNGLLRAVFRLLDIDDARLLLKLSKIIIYLRNSGSTLTNACKLLFKLSKSEVNDYLFIEEDILPLVLRLLRDHSMNAIEALVYGVGMLKNLSNEDSAQKYLSRHGCIESLGSVITAARESLPVSPTSSQRLGHLLVQVTAALRNMAVSTSNRRIFVHSKIIPELMSLLQLYPRDADLSLNISRILSKLTLHNDCRAVLSSLPNAIKTFVGLLEQSSLNHALIIRICFILGNLTANSDEDRHLIVKVGGIDVIMSLLKQYHDLDLRDSDMVNGDTENEHEVGECSTINPSAGTKKRVSVSDTEDVLIKLIRLLANLAISPDIGPGLAAYKGIELLHSLLEHKTMESSEELVLNIAGAINNLSFYNGEDNVVLHLQVPLGRLLVPLLRHNNNEALLETARVLGNFSRDKAVRQLMTASGVDELMVLLLEHESREINFTVCGVLMNLMGDSEHRSVFEEADGVRKLIDLLVRVDQKDWRLATLVCKTLCNYCATSDGKQCFLSEKSSFLAAELRRSIQSESQDDMFFEFKNVAQRLLGFLDGIIAASPDMVPLSREQSEESDGYDDEFSSCSEDSDIR